MDRSGTVLARVRARLNLDKDIALIEASGYFDLDHYRRQAGRNGLQARDAIRAYLLAAPLAKPSPSRLFDPAWYTVRHRDCAFGRLDPLVHYILHGAAELRDPHPLFDVKYYMRENGLLDNLRAPLLYFLHTDTNRLRSPHPLFDSALYVELYPDAAEMPLLHYLDVGAAELRTPHRLFDPRTFLAHANLEPGPRLNPLAAYLSGRTDVRTHYLFDPKFYLETYPDIGRAGINPLVHYLTHGDREGRLPSPFFDRAWYVNRHPAALKARRTTLEYFLVDGIAAGHDPNEYFDSAFYLETYPEVALCGAPAIQHFLDHGLARGLMPSRAFDPAFYRADNPALGDSGEAPFAHFMRKGRFEGRRPYGPERPLREEPFAVILNLVYLDLLPEFERLLAPLNGLLDVFIAVPADAEALFRNRIAAALPAAQVIAVANEDGDVDTFFEVARRIDISRYVAVCKIHGKKALSEPDVWRFVMLQSLLGSRTLVEDIAAAFKFDRDVWFVGPAPFYISARKFTGHNTRTVVRLVGDLYPHLWPDLDWGFFAGTMFWVRPAAIDRLGSTIAMSDRFGTEGLANDGDISHAIERVVTLACAIERKKVGLVTLDGDAFDRQTFVVEAAGQNISTEEPAEVLARLAGRLGARVPRSSPAPVRAPAPPPAILSRRGGVNLVGPLGVVGGLGTSARGYLRLLEETGIAVNCIDWAHGFNRLSRLPVRLPRMSETATVNVVHINLDLLVQGRFVNRGPLAELMVKGRRNILIFYWELPTLKPEWLEPLGHFDEVWCPTTFIESAVRSASTIPTRLLRPELRTPPTTHATPDRDRLKLPADRFVFAYVLDGGGIVRRKNPQALISAFRAEFREDENAFCVLKISYSGVQPAELAQIVDMIGDRRDIVVSNEIFDDDTMDVFFQSIDCYVSPHRSEGLGLTIIEAMQHGKPVIATPFGGARDFVTETFAFPLDYQMSEVGPGAEPYPADYLWAEPSVPSLRAQMRRVFSDKDEGTQRAAAAARRVSDVFAANAAAAGELCADARDTDPIRVPSSDRWRKQA